MNRSILVLILRLLPGAIRIAALLFPNVREHLAAGDWTIGLRLRDNSLARQISFNKGKISAAWETTAKADAEIVFMDVATARKLLAPKTDYAFVIDALKNFKITQVGSDAALLWFGGLINAIQSASRECGTEIEDGTTRYVTPPNGGPFFVCVKDDKIIRTTPIDLADDDAPSWCIEARGQKFKPQRRATVSPHALSLKSLVYSDKRILYPMKRIDFDPKGERNPRNRGKSGYERISWDEALDIVV